MDGNFSLSTALVTSSLTVTGGLIVFIISQLVLKFMIEPLSDYRKIRSQISINLVFYANIYLNPVELTEQNLKNESIRSELAEVHSKLRKQASEFTGVMQVIPFYGLFSCLGLVPPEDKAHKVSSNLIGIANSLWKQQDPSYNYIDVAAKT